MLRLVSSDRPALEIERDSVLGRDASADVVVDDRSVSRRHARVARHGDGWRIEDLGSGNGTWIDGQRVSTAPLANGQELRLGTMPFRVELAGDVATMLVPALANTPASHVGAPHAGPGAPPPIPGADPYSAYAQPQYHQPAAGYAQPAPGYAGDPYAARPSGGGSGLLKVVGAVVIAYLVYDHFAGRKQEAGPPPAGGGGGGQTQPAPAGSVRVAGIAVKKSRAADGGTQALIQTAVEGFKLRAVDGGAQISLVRDVEVVLPDGTRVDQLSTSGQVLEQVIEPTERVTLDYSLTIKPGVKATVIYKTRIRDQVSGTSSEGQTRIDFP